LHRIGGKMWVVGSIETMVRKLIGLQKGGTNAVEVASAIVFWPPSLTNKPALWESVAGAVT